MLVDVLVLDPLLHRPNALAAALCWLTGGDLALGVISLAGVDEEPDPQSETRPHPFLVGGCGGGGGVSGISSVGNGGSVSPRMDELPSVEDGSPIAFSAMTVMHKKIRQSPVSRKATSGGTRRVRYSAYTQKGKLGDSTYTL